MKNALKHETNLASPDATKDFRAHLQQEFERRSRRNSGYSLRAFANHLQVSPATLSQYLNGKRKMTMASIMSIGEALGLSPKELYEFCQTSAKPDRRRKSAKLAPQAQYKEINLEIFNAAADWKHDAILELTRLQSFRPDPKWISKVLGLPVNEINIAVERLQKLDLLEITPENKWKDLSDVSTTIVHNEFTSSALRKYQQSILEKSKASVDNFPISERDHTSIMLTIKKSDMPQIKEHIKRMRRELADLIRVSRPIHDEVYLLSVSLFPVSQIGLKEKTR